MKANGLEIEPKFLLGGDLDQYSQDQLKKS
jgi:hypothetical protein